MLWSSYTYSCAACPGYTVYTALQLPLKGIAGYAVLEDNYKAPNLYRLSDLWHVESLQ